MEKYEILFEKKKENTSKREAKKSGSGSTGSKFLSGSDILSHERVITTILMLKKHCLEIIKENEIDFDGVSNSIITSFNLYDNFYNINKMSYFRNIVDYEKLLLGPHFRDFKVSLIENEKEYIEESVDGEGIYCMKVPISKIYYKEIADLDIEGVYIFINKEETSNKYYMGRVIRVDNEQILIDTMGTNLDYNFIEIDKKKVVIGKIKSITFPEGKSHYIRLPRNFFPLKGLI